MKILFLTFYFQPDLCAGSFRASAILNELKNNPNIKIDVLTTMPNRYVEFKADAANVEKFENVEVTRLEIPSHKSGIFDQIRSFSSFYFQVRSVIKKSNYDFVFATSSRLFTAFLGANIAKRKKIPLYLDIRDLARDTLVNLYKPPIKYLLDFLLYKIERYTFNSATHINFVSEGFQNYIEKNYTDLESSIFSNGIDPEFMDLDSYDAAKIKKNTHSDKINIIYAGNIGAGQALEKIIPELALQLKTQVVFKIVGSGSRSQMLKSKIKKLKLRNVLIVDPIPRSELKIEYQKADVLFLHLDDLAAFEKVLPSKIFEYAATGKPIMAGVKGYPRKFMEQKLSGSVIFDPCDINDALKAFEKISFVKNDRDSFKKEFSRDIITKKMVEDILRVCNNEK